jgi:hypothetical protein
MKKIILIFILLFCYKGFSQSTDKKILFEKTEKNARNDKLEIQPFAQLELGEMYYDGKGTEKDLKKAFYWFKKSAENGVVGANAKVAYMYYDGEGTLKSYKDAFYYIQRGLGFELDAKSLFYIGRMYFFGQGTETDKIQAAYWIKKAYDAPEISGNEYQQKAQQFWEENELWKYE